MSATALLKGMSFHRMTRKEVVARLRPLLHLPGLKLSYHTAYLRALEIYTTYRIDFEDALSKAHMERQKITDIYSYDKDFDQVAEIMRTILNYYTNLLLLLSYL